MSVTQPLGPRNQWEQLTRVLPIEQREQLAEILLSRLVIGWGEIQIIVRDFHIKEFREVNTIPSIKPTNNGVIEP